MRTRLAVSILASMILTLLVVIPAGAHHDDGKGDAEPAAIDVLMHEFEDVTAPNAAEESNAPRGHAPCIRGMAAGVYPCDGVDMMARVSLADLGDGVPADLPQVQFVNGIWGWTDAATGTDYALVGTNAGMVVVDVGDAKRPDVIGLLPTATQGAFIWRDIKVYDDHAFVVSQDPGHACRSWT